MAKKGYRTCNSCKETFKKETMVQMNTSKFLCEECYDKVGKESKDYTTLIRYVCDIFKISQPTGLILNQIRKFHNEGYTYFGMAYTIDYYLNVQKRKFDKQSLGMIPYFYEHARQHKESIEKAQLSVENISAKRDSIIVKTKQNRNNNRIKRTRYIDISKL